ncbi:neuromedin-S isoform X1 [Mustela erminea]|uniref:neuromedin-S isoform X1 n=2 Tax=Mustela erminea TaxID=36723 RepID=UPI0013866A3B|nr:neuromedin-S isoform X1 [Mustela erminea]
MCGRTRSRRVCIQNTGFPRPLADPPDGLDIMQLERLAYWAALSRQPKDDQDIHKRFLFHYSRTQKPIHPVKSGFPPVHPLMRMAAQLVNRKVKRFLQQREARGHSQLTVSLEDAVPVTLTCVSFTHRIQGLLQWISPRRITLPPGDDHFSFSGQGMEETLKITPSRTVREFSGKEKLD